MGAAKGIVLRPIERREADALIKRVHYSGKVVNNFAESYEQMIRERKNAIRQDANDGIGPYKYSHIRITRAALRRETGL